MSKPYTQSAAQTITATLHGRGVRGFDPLTILSFLSLLLPLLMGFCQKPTPEQGYAHLTWKPFRFFDWFGSRLQRHRHDIELVAQRQWAGDSAGFRDTMAAIWSVIDGGRLTPMMMADLYSEHY